MKKHIPNFITLLNLFSGCVAVCFAFKGQMGWAFAMILLAAVFDFCDGYAARLFKAYSEIGKQLDSLADMISFGFAPAVMVFYTLQQSNLPYFLHFTAFLLAVFSALRLAKFNIDDRQTTSFIGMPTPANAIFWAGAISSFSDICTSYAWFTVILILLFSFLMISEIPFFSFKAVNFKKGIKNNAAFLTLIIGSCILAAISLLNAASLIIIWYIVVSLIFSKKNVLC
jgi:CDP-diacylglycerol--serine O-phosphatidyltransferase